MKTVLMKSKRIRGFFGRLSSLVLLFQRSPIVQMLFPEARILGASGLGEVTKWGARAVLGLGAFDTVAGATTISQLSPSANSASVPAALGSNLTFIFQLLNYPDTPGSWTVTGLPTGLTHANAKNNTTDSVSGIPTQAGTFSVVVRAYSGSNASGDSYSRTFTMNVGTAIITTPPASVSINSGSTTTLTVVGSGTPLTYQWYQGASPSTALPVGTNSPSFTTPALSTLTSYWVKVTRSGVVANSPTATVGINQPAAITVHPSVSGPIGSGATASMSVTASGTGPFTYQWYEGESPSTSTPVGTNSNLFTTPPLVATTRYWVKVTNAANPTGANSNTVVVAVNSINPFEAWKSSVFNGAQLVDPLISGLSSDPDGDGISNANEYVFGLNPLFSNAAQGPVVGIAGGQLSLQFTAQLASGAGYSGKVRHYALESSNSLESATGPWTALSGFEDVIGNGQSVSHSVALAPANQFFRLRVWLTP